VNVAPFDVRQGNFGGRGREINHPLGTNQFAAPSITVSRRTAWWGPRRRPDGERGRSSSRNTGGWVVGSRVPNQALFFFNGRDELLTQPEPRFGLTSGARRWVAARRACWRRASTASVA